MSGRFIFFCPVLCLLFFSSCVSHKSPAPFGATPSKRQLQWHNMHYYAFIHFGPNTFTDIEWGHGDESPDLFNPTELNTDQWARVIKDAGMEGIIITAKHHDGFCLWPSAYSTHTVRESKWRDGKGDVLKDLAASCEKFDLKLGVYLSPWDRNHPAYGTDAYNDVFKNMLKEVLTSYGPIFEVWFDGANGEGPKGKRQVYDFPGFADVVRKYQPDAVIFSDAGPDIRWIGNERGYAGTINWSTVRDGTFYPGIPDVNDQLQTGHEDGDIWLPAEVNTSIRPGWFYHQEEDDDVKSVNQLIDNWYHSVGMNGNFLLNLPVDTRGRVHESDIASLQGLNEYLKMAFKNDLAKDQDVSASSVFSNQFLPQNLLDGDLKTFWAASQEELRSEIIIDLGESQEVNTILLQEYIKLGQRVRSFEIQIYNGEQFKPIFSGQTIGNRRLVRFKTVLAQQIKIILEAKAPSILNNLEIYRVPERLSVPIIQRKANGEVSIQVDSRDPVIYYTLDGSDPDTTSLLYKGPFTYDQKGIIKARSYIERNSKSSEVISQRFDIPKHLWNIRSTCGHDDQLRRLIDGEGGTIWTSDMVSNAFPCDIIIDLGSVIMLEAVGILPRQDHRTGGHVREISLSLSQDGANWRQEIQKFEFANIRNNPVEQHIELRYPVSCRFIRITLLENLEDAGWASVAEINVVTK